MNGDGVTDLVTVEQSQGAMNADVGRGDGTFVLMPGHAAKPGGLPVLADFDGDGVLDVVHIYPDTPADGSSHADFSKGAADGSFSTVPVFFDLGMQSVTSGVAGDFDGDGKQDVAVAGSDASSTSKGRLVLLRGNGDGTFSTPATTIASQAATPPAPPLAADLNGDGKLGLIWGNTVLLDNGSTAPTALDLSVPGTAMAVADVNGDHIPDLVVDNMVYAGRGDGTFQPQALVTIPVPAGASLISAAIGDLNGDGNPDIVLQYMADMAGLAVAYGDGRGGFTMDTNTYVTGAKTPISGALARLNNSAPNRSADNRLDYLVFADGAAISLLNRSNPAPPPPVLVPTTLQGLTLTGSQYGPHTPAPLEPVQFWTGVTGVNPTGFVTFTAQDGTVLGKAPVSNAGTVASLQYAFPAAGTYTVTASYPGDTFNAPAVSAPASIVIAKYATTILSNQAGAYYAGRNYTFYFSVTGYNPTAPVTFFSGTTQLGSAALTSGGTGFVTRGAQTSISFPSAGTYYISATYPGDASNLPATSPAYAMTVSDPPDFSISANPTTNTVSAGQTATYTLSITSVRGYSGHVALTCQPACPASGVSVFADQTATATFSVQTTSGGASGAPRFRYAPIGAMVLLFGLRRRYFKALPPQLRTGLFTLFLALGFFSISACSSSNNPSPTSTKTGTTYGFVITGTDSSIPASHSVTLQLIVQ